MLLLSLPCSWKAELMLSGSGRFSFTPGLDCYSHTSVFSNEFLWFCEHILQVPSCWLLACVWTCSAAATAKPNKQPGSKTGSLGLGATGIPERMGMNLTLGEWESIQLLGNKLNLTNENCSFIWIGQAVSFSQYLPDNQVLHPASDTPRIFQFLDFHPSFWLCLEPSLVSLAPAWCSPLTQEVDAISKLTATDSWPKLSLFQTSITSTFHFL